MLVILGMGKGLTDVCKDEVELQLDENKLLLELVVAILAFLDAPLTLLFYQSGRSCTAMSIMSFLNGLHLRKWVSTESVL